MLEGLAHIDWSGLGIPEVPTWLYQLRSEDKHIREQAFSNLGQNIVPVMALMGAYSSENLLWLVQRDAVPFVVPFLIELLSDAPNEGKELILELLHDLAWYVGTERYVANSELEDYRRCARCIFNAVLKGSDIYMGLLGHASPQIDQAVFDLIAILNHYITDSWHDQP